MEFETREKHGRIHVIKNGVESVSFAEQKPGGTWAIMKPYAQCLGTLEETLAMIAADMDTWYTATQAAKVLYYPCWACNWRGARGVPDDLEPISVTDVQAWFDRDPMSPDYAALAAEPEPVLASLVDRESAGLEG